MQIFYPYFAEVDAFCSGPLCVFHVGRAFKLSLMSKDFLFCVTGLSGARCVEVVEADATIE